MTCTVARSLVLAVAVGVCMSLAACAPTPSFEDDVAAARSPRPVTQAPLAVPTVPAPDPSGDAWVDYFDIDDGGIVGGAASSSAGSFGPPGQIIIMSNADLAIPAGYHTVEVSCAGAPLVTVTLAGVSEATGMAEPSDPSGTTDIDCPVSALLEISLDTPGLFVTLDSHGEPGAFLVRVDPGGVLEAP